MRTNIWTRKRTRMKICMTTKVWMPIIIDDDDDDEYGE